MEEQMNIRWHDEAQEKPEICRRGGVTFLRYPALERTGLVRHGFSTRLGGVSEGIYASMNLSFTRGDDPGAVMENYRRIAAALEIPLTAIVTSDQTHTTHVRQVGKADCGSGVCRERRFADVDGMITDEPGVALATFYADCVPLYFVDTENRAIGLSHSGWRGTRGKMGRVTAEAMQRAFGTRPEKLLAAVGPSICRDCYEVSEDVAMEFQEAFAPALHDRILRSRGDGKYLLDLWEANYQVLLEAGLRPENISMPNLCTCCNPGFLFSHRASGGRRGNLGAFLMLREEQPRRA